MITKSEKPTTQTKVGSESQLRTAHDLPRHCRVFGMKGLHQRVTDGQVLDAVKDATDVDNGDGAHPDAQLDGEGDGWVLGQFSSVEVLLDFECTLCGPPGARY